MLPSNGTPKHLVKDERSPKRERSSKSALEKRPEPVKAVVDAASLLENQDFITDFARYSEAILDEKFLRRKYKFDPGVWERLGSDEVLIERIEDERLRRQRSGESKREIAQKHIIKAPAILDSIMSDPSANNRHRVDAIKTLDAIAAPPAQTPAADASRFVIQINLGTDADGREIVEHYNKPRAIGISDDGSSIDAAPQELVAITTKNRSGSDSDGGRSL
jgi:hypothetical protein